MKRIALAALAGVLASPGIAGAVTSAPIGPSGVPYHLYHFDLRPIDHPTITPQPPGDLELDFGTGGIINGYFRPHDSGRYVPVTGGNNGGRIWLRIGSGSTFDRLDGRMAGDRIIGTARFGGGSYFFRLLPESQLSV